MSIREAPPYCPVPGIVRFGNSGVAEKVKSLGIAQRVKKDRTRAREPRSSASAAIWILEKLVPLCRQSRNR